MIAPIPYGKQHITSDDITAVIEVLQSDFLTQGPKVSEFESAFSSYIGCKYSVAVSNGTAALHLSVLALNLKPGDKVITSPITFSASANCVRYLGGEIVFADIDPETYLLDIRKVEALLDSSPKGTYKGIIPVDFAGRPIAMDVFRKLADDHGLWILEDACHAPGGFFYDVSYNKQNCGNAKFADLSIFSFHPVKHIATGEGGMITTDNEQLYNRLLKLRTHGITRNKVDFKNTILFASSETLIDQYPDWYMEMHELGYNYRLTEIQAALGLSQLKRAEQGIARRNEIANIYNNAFESKSFIKGHSGKIEGHAYHLYIIEVERRLELYNYLRNNNVFGQIHYIPVHLMPYYRELGWKEGDMPFAEEYYKKCISLPIYPSLTDEEVNYVIDLVSSFF